jgi:hypothetical protein
MSLFMPETDYWQYQPVSPYQMAFSSKSRLMQAPRFAMLRVP